MKHDEDLVTTQQATKIVGVHSHTTICRRVTLGFLKPVSRMNQGGGPGSQYLFRRADVIAEFAKRPAKRCSKKTKVTVSAMRAKKPARRAGPNLSRIRGVVERIPGNMAERRLMMREIAKSMAMVLEGAGVAGVLITPTEVEVEYVRHDDSW